MSKNTNNTYISEYLRNHSINTQEDIDNILNMEESDIQTGAAMKNAEEFNENIINEIKAGNRILVFGDYDTDGVMATVVAVRALRSLSKILTGTEGHISYYINDRFVDGYGISAESIRKILLRNPKLDTIITVDNGIVAFDAVDYAKTRGLKVIITDHHQPLETVPNAYVVVDPHQAGDLSKFKEISGTTVIYKLMLNLFDTYFHDDLDLISNLIDFVGVSVVSDVMPMLYENRIYVKKAVDVFNNKGAQRLRLSWYVITEYLHKIGKLKGDSVFTEQDFGFVFSPIINAQSRINGQANIAVDLFLSTSTDDIREKASFMVDVNEERKDISNAAFARVMETDYSGMPIVIIRDDTLGEGVIGLIAGKITEAYNRPSVVLTAVDDNTLKGSARSIEGVNILNELRKLDKHMTALGGHAGAAGLSLKLDEFNEFKEEAIEQLSHVVPADLGNDVIADMTIQAEDFSKSLVNDFNELAPFGNGFEKPLFEVKDLKITDSKVIGKQKDHLRIVSKDTTILLWGGAKEFADDAKESNSMDVIGNPGINVFNNKESLQLIVEKNAIVFHK